MIDELPRLPTSRMQVVLNLGERTSARFALPGALRHPELDAQWDDETNSTSVSIEYRRGQFHAEVDDDGIAYHFHDLRGDQTDRSPFARADQKPFLDWALAFAADVHAIMPGLEEDAAEAVAWHEAGYALYVCETEPAQLDLLEVDIEGEVLTLPWLGAGTVEQEHTDGDDHPIQLLWTPTPDAADRPIARAWLDPRTDSPRTAGLPGVEWTAVGLAEDEVLSWLEGVYLNQHIIEDPASAVILAALKRMAGI